MNGLKRLLAIIGSAKSGTTALANYLGSHPDIVMGMQKEPRFFANLSSKGWQGPGAEGFAESFITSEPDYLANFPGLSPQKWAVDASTDYIWAPDAPQRLKVFAEHCDVRIVAIVRDPIERAISEYNHTLRHGWETLSFAGSISAEKSRREKAWHPLFYHQRRSRISQDVRRYHDLFGDKLFVMDYAELEQGAEWFDRLSDFLGISGFQQRSIERLNTTILPRNRLVGRLIENPVAREVGRRVAPRNVRKVLWKLAHVDAREIETVTTRERAEFRKLMDDEIRLCVADPLIPTDNWTCTETR